jgi:hypothetical protein
VDTNILQGASRTDDGPPAGVRCRAVLSDILQICHRAVISPPLEEEYRRHASDYGDRWWSAMTRKNKVVRTPARETSRARRWLQSEALASNAQREELRKDMHLVMAALETDELIVTSEIRSRDLLRGVVSDDDHTPGWVVLGDDTTAWLADGAPLLPEHRVQATDAVRARVPRQKRKQVRRKRR